MVLTPEFFFPVESNVAVKCAALTFCGPRSAVTSGTGSWPTLLAKLLQLGVGHVSHHSMNREGHCYHFGWTTAQAVHA